MLLALAASLNLMACQPYSYRATVLDSPKPLKDFTLDSADGSPFTLSGSDKLLLLYFGYTHCLDVCPATLAQLKIARQKLGDKASAVQVAFITVDPERDTEARLTAYLANFDPSFIGLRTTNAALLQDIAEDFGAYYQADQHEPLAEQYLVTHTSSILVVRDTKLLAAIPDDATGEEIANDVIHLLSR